MNDRAVRILLSILFFPIGLILAIAGVRTKIIAWCFAGFYLWLLGVIVVVGIIGSMAEEPPGAPVQAAVPSTSGYQPGINMWTPDTSLVSSTPAPAQAAAQECPTSEEALYILTVRSNAIEMAGHMEDVGRLSTQASIEPTLLLDEAWQLEIVLTLALLDASADTIDAMAPPASARSIDQDMVKIGNHLRKVAVLYVQGLDTLDADLLLQASAHMEAIAPLAVSAGQKMDSFCQ